MGKKYLTAAILGFFAFNVQAADVGLKISAGDTWVNWGDYILGHDLKQGIEKLGYSVQPAYQDDYYPEGSHTSSIDIYMHGFIPFNPPKKEGRKNVLYLYYPLETANMAKFKNLENVRETEWYSLETELWNFDLIAVASPIYQKEIEKLGLKTVFTPQFTNPEKFYYEYDEKSAYDILFVGRPGYERISAVWAIESKFDVALFGSGWQDKYPEHFKGEYIENDKLHTFYSSAKIVLNDTREDMKKSGFISNRVFDVTASGGFLISDYLPEIEMFYGESIPMFKTKEELAELIDYYLKHPEERAAKAKKAQAITLEKFTNKAVAQTIFKALSDEQTDDIERTKETETEIDQPSPTLALKFSWPERDMYIGDYWLGLDMEEGLKENGFDVRHYYKVDEHFMEDDFYQNAENMLHLQFKFNDFKEENTLKNKILYLYFPTEIPERGKFRNIQNGFIHNTDVYLDNYLEFFDLIATPAKAVYKNLQQKGYQTAFVPQFTNPDKFYYAPDEKLKTDLLFVGSPWYERISALYAAELGYDLAVYGLNWKGKIDEAYLKGEYIDNTQLNKYYSSAKIVLSDHAEDLEAMGLVINRLYDATAVGTLVISEYSPYIEEIFGDTVPLFKTKEEFKRLVDYYLAHPKEREIKAKAAQKITLENYTNKIIGKQFKQLFQQLRREKK